MPRLGCWRRRGSVVDSQERTNRSTIFAPSPRQGCTGQIVHLVEGRVKLGHDFVLGLVRASRGSCAVMVLVTPAWRT